MTLSKKGKAVAQKYAPPSVARLGKRFGVYPRYRQQRRACRAGYATYGSRYPQHILFVAGLPKSGTTWLEKMLAEFPGYHDLLIPDVAAYELSTGGSHDYDLPDDMFTRFSEMLVLTKMHVHGSRHNAALLRRHGIRYVVLYRDLRDVAVSYVHYVSNTPWHPEHSLYAGEDLKAGLARFGERLLPAYRNWVLSWHANHDPALGLIITYEQMLDDTTGVFQDVVRHFELGDSAETVSRIVDAHSFAKLKQTNAHDTGFFRKGVAGDWRNHFSDDLIDQYRAAIGDFLVDFGYESDTNW